MAIQEQTKELVPGLAGVPAAESAISFIDGVAGVLAYRGYRIETLSEESTFEETAWLLLHGELPTRAELDAFRARLRGARDLPADVLAAIAAMPRGGHPMNAMQAGFALLGMTEPRPDLDDDGEKLQAIERLLAAAPVLVAAFQRARTGQPYVAPDPDLDTAGNFLWMINGEKPDELAARILDVALILHADHTMNASTFAARVVASTEADPYSVCSAAVGALHGPLHGGANERVLKQLSEIGGAENVGSWLEEKLASKSKVMGFGHRVYKVKDPRAHNIQALMRELFAKLGSTPIYDTALELERQMEARVGSKGIAPNVDYFSGIVYQKLGIPTDLFTPVFGIARTAGWLAHWREQMQDNKLFRPAQVYVGSPDRDYVPIDRR